MGSLASFDLVLSMVTSVGPTVLIIEFQRKELTLKITSANKVEYYDENNLYPVLIYGK